MPLLILLPIFALAALQVFWPQHEFHTSVPFPATPFVIMALVGLLAGLMRQWQWLYWLALLAGHYWAAQIGLQRPLSEPDVAALYMLLPLLVSVFMLLLAVIPLPTASSVPGVLLLFACFFLPVAMTDAPLVAWLLLIDLPEFMLARPQAGWFLTWGHLWWQSVILFIWLALVSVRRYRATVWGCFAVWLAVMLFYALIDRVNASGWVTLAAGLSLLLTLAYEMLRLAYVDELTQLPQRRALEGHLSRLGRRSAICMLDVDHFKQFNDTWGHEVGDQVLRLLGSILADVKGLSAYRYGGEEFTLVFSHNRADAIAEKLEDVRQRVENYPLTLRRDDRPDSKKDGKAQRGKASGTQKVNITISLGCALRQPKEEPEALLKRADEALYSAKKAGRNCVKIAK
ncbi:GGDEF domain-containing protein [Salinispirillum sp. LH 10-3-1]|uniref:diguanylate cyclase n=1 Tax=Salinispirillum sp. LH 10-3-1 TaxID=2952525 RepID=A0AB38YIS7_9GAMM